MPRVTIVCSFRNEVKFIGDAVESINRQTFRDFDAVFIDDGSTDGGAEIVRSRAKFDYRILTNPTSLGLSKSLNRGVDAADGELIARIDADDMMLPNRLDVQTRYFDQDPRLVLLGASALKVDEKGKTIGSFYLPIGDRDCKFALNFYSPFIHPATMFKKECFYATEGYCVESDPAEDFRLWCALAMVGNVDNVPEPLMKYRIRASSITGSRRKEQLAKHHSIIKTFQMHVRPTARYLPLHIWKVVKLLSYKEFEGHRTVLSKAFGILLNGITSGRLAAAGRE